MAVSKSTCRSIPDTNPIRGSERRRSHASRRLRWELDEAPREGNRRCCAQMEAVEARERDRLYPAELDPDEAVVRESQSRESAKPGTAQDAENPRRPR